MCLERVYLNRRGIDMPCKKTTITTAFLLLTLAQPVFADFNTQMNSMFSSMTNVTAPQGYMDQSRGVITGGRVTVKSKIVSAQLMAFDPPRIDSGCGGIDWFAGSFSFISADQFVQLMRSIGANAAGYAFKLALTNMCPSCASIMEDLRKTVAAANSLAGDSCQAAKKIVDTISVKLPANEGFGIEAKADQIQTARGGFADAFSGWVDNIGKDKSATQDGDEDTFKKEGVIGNVAWNVFTKEADNGAKMLTGFASSDTATAEAIMSLTGTVVSSKSSGDAKAQIKIVQYENVLSLIDLMGERYKESSVSLWKCNDSVDCLEPVMVENQSIEPMIKKIRRLLLGVGGDGSGGLVSRYAANQGGLSDEEKAFMELSPLHGKRIRDLAIFGTEGARVYAEGAAEKIALDLVTTLVNKVLDSVTAAASMNDDPKIAAFQARLHAVRMEINDEATKISQKIQTDQNISTLFQNLRAATDRSQYSQIVSEIRINEKKNQIVR